MHDWFRAHSSALSGLDPDAPLDDLEPLRDLVGDARVVAVGEGAHFVREFTHARLRVLRFLAERCGFTVLAFEFGFAEAFALDRWLSDDGRDGDEADEAGLAALGGTPYAGVNGELVRRLRRHNRTSGHPLRFVGVDLPTAAGELRPALEPLAGYLREVDPAAVARVDSALAVADGVTGSSGAVAAPRWARLTAAEQDALTASLARLLLRFRALAPLYVERSDQAAYDTALRHLEAAAHTDYMFGAMRDLFAGEGAPGDTSVREAYMAQSLHWHLDRAAPGTRVVLDAHNNHIQKTPVSFGGELIALPMGHYLHRALGDGYRALALTHTADHVPEMHPDPEHEAGFEVVEERLGEPTPGSVEAALAGAGLGGAVTLTSLRQGPPTGLDSIRSQSAEMPTPVGEAFDGVLCSPTVTTSFTESVHGGS
ncbi:erythromycin esterase family protein [Streptomyces armeniacus]|uniref:Erythromycin esterase family protein n=1 Tax=Streptomyces armeniacus TaxID=83291 RepID=A0A345XJ05_9ACTN|nr:erythromycin esterase family protein [Streptomyces armeniacus]AXK31621.1 erythromycin esterase family protein [Streptomyces armeniacus]